MKVQKENPDHGGHRRRFAEAYGLREEDIIDFSSNINPFGPPASLKRIFSGLWPELGFYPDPEAKNFCREAAAFHRVGADQVLGGNGAVALLELAIRICAPKRALIVEPCFTEYRRLLEAAGAAVKSIRLSEEADFRFEPDQVKRELPSIDFLVLGHPNSPTGTLFPADQMLDLVREAARYKSFVLIDEAFIDWNPGLSLIPRLEFEGLPCMVLRSMTKFYALAGVRAGYAIAGRSLIRAMRARQEVWSFNRIAQELSTAAFQDEAFRTDSLSWYAEESRHFHEALCGIQGLKVYPSQANYFLVRFPQKGTAAALASCLGRAGMMVRSCGNYPGLDDSFCRFALRRRTENEILVRFVKDFLRQPAGVLS